MRFEQKKTPGPTTEGISENHHSHDESVTSSIADRGEFFAQILDGVHVVVAEIKSPGPEPRFRRHFYMSLAAAQRKVDRATQDGKLAYMYLAQLHVVDGDHCE